MPDIIHRIGIMSSPAPVYKALSTTEGLANWWTEEVEGEEQVGGNIQFTFRTKSGDIRGQMIMQVQELQAQKKVLWHCVSGPGEWIGTKISFDLSQQDNQTIIVFSHSKWTEAVEFMAHCSMKWAVFLLSLREYVEHGKGKPSPNDLKIDNWN